MASLDLLQRHLFPSTVVLGVLLGGVVGLFVPIRAASPPKAANQAWSLPTVADSKRFHDDDYQALRSARFWKTVAVPGQRGAPKVEWTLAAIITRPRPMAAITQPGAKQPSVMVAVGAALPDGATLLRLTRDAVWFEKDGCVRERRLFRAVTAENNACLGEASPAATDPTPASTPGPGTPRSAAPASASPRLGPDPAATAPSPPSARTSPRAAGAATP